MLIKSLLNCGEFEANDGCRIRELLHPDRDAVDVPYSIAIARVAPGKSTYRHKLKQTEVYYILEGGGSMHIDDEVDAVSAGDAVLIPPQSVQWIDNTGTTALLFAAIVSPPWQERDDIRL